MQGLRIQPPYATSLRFKRFLVLAGVGLIFFGLNGVASGQTPNAPASILGRVVGDNVSVVGASQVISGGVGHAIEFSGGNTIVVFSGKARVEFTGGGELDVCGPAKFTVLSSGEALTVALSFGRVRAHFDASRPITIYMPLVIATPIPIGDQPRDATVGLTNTGTMCVLAANGAVRLQNQLSGDSTIVPQPSEVFVSGSSFASLPPAAGQCRCDFDESAAQQSAPHATAPAVASSIPREETATPSDERKRAAPQNPPNIASASKSAPPLVVSNQPATAVTLPPIAYDAKSATETPEPISVATLVLAQQTVVQPEWIFHGTVVDSGKKQNARQDVDSAAQAPDSQEKPRKRSFWAKLRHFFIGL